MAVERNGSANSPDGGVCPGRSERGDVSAALGSAAGGASGLSAMGGRLMRRLGQPRGISRWRGGVGDRALWSSDTIWCVSGWRAMRTRCDRFPESMGMHKWVTRWFIIISGLRGVEGG